MNKNQRGSIESIAIVILVAVLIGAIGYIAYTNLGKNSAKEDDKVSSSSSAKLVEYCAVTEGICFDYPNNWKLEARQEVDDINGNSLTLEGGDVVTLTSPDGNMTLRLVTKISGLGGACDSPDGPVSVVRSQPVNALGDYEVDDYNGQTALAAAVVYSMLDDDGAIIGYQPEVVLSTSKDFEYVHTYDACAGRPFGSFLDGHANAPGVDKTSLSFVSIDPKQRVYDTLDEAKAALDTENYKVINTILLSSRYK